MSLSKERKKEIIDIMRKAHLLSRLKDETIYKDRDEHGLGLIEPYVLEALDDKHRDKELLNNKYAQWLQLPSTEENKNFWRWLDKTYPELNSSKGVSYFDEASRNKFKIELHDGILMRLGDTQPFDTSSFKGKKSGFAAYVMDRKGTLYIAEHKTGAMHHSSFVAGAIVLSAGMVKIEQGKIVAIDHHSGHYCPTKEHFEKALRKMDKNIFAEDAKITMNKNEIKSASIAKIAHFFMTIKENSMFNWLPNRIMFKLSRLGYYLEHSNQKNTTVSAKDYYKEEYKDTLTSIREQHDKSEEPDDQLLPARGR